MKKLLLISSLLVLGTAAIGQVKIGTNPATLATNANLQVEGTTTAQQFVVLKNGNVGIGTSAPGAGLQVANGGALFSGQGIVNAQGLQIHWNNGTLQNGGSRGYTSFLNHRGGGEGGFTFSSTVSPATDFVEYMRINSAGNVGIGTNAPTSKLEVVNNVPFNPSSNDLGAIKVSGTYGGGIVFAEGANRAAISAPFGDRLTFLTGGTVNGGTEQMTIRENGNVGIGTNNPTDKLHVVGSTSITNSISTGGVLRLGSLGTGDRNSFIDLFAADNPTFNARIIRGSGVNGTLRLSNEGTGAIIFNTEANSPHLTVAGTTGYVGINRIGLVPLDVNGVLRVTGNGTINDTGTQLTFNDGLLGGTGNAISGFVNNRGATGTSAGGFIFATTTDNVTINKVLEIDFTGNITQNATGYLKVATGTTAQRPGTATAGMIRFNTTLSKFEGYDGTAWILLN